MFAVRNLEFTSKLGIIILIFTNSFVKILHDNV